jgi:hypothetical protein
MSEYQYYEFQAIDRPLSEADRQVLRDLSTRARITATSFTNSYEWGDFKGDPAKLMERWFDLHLYLANWGSRRLMIRLPKRLVDRRLLDAFLSEVDCATFSVSGENLIVDISCDEVEFENWDDGSGWLAALAPLRAEVLAGDLRLFYLLWLTAVQAEVFEADQPEPMPGIGPMSASLEAFAEFFGIDLDLVHAAAERSAVAAASAISAEAVEGVISAMTDADKTTMLSRLFNGDPNVAAELRAKVSDRMASDADAPPIADRRPDRRRTACARRRDRPCAREGGRGEARRRTRSARERRRESPPSPAIGDSAAGRRRLARGRGRNRAAQRCGLRQGGGASPRSSSSRQGTRCNRGLPSSTSGDPRKACPQGTVHRTAGSIGVVYHALVNLAETEGFEPSIGLYNPITV